MKSEVIIVGAGIFGCELALQFESAGYHVIVVEKESEILTGASRLNQNRLHLGYHYPRSRETALQASEAYQDFSARFSSAIRTDEESFYCVSKNDSLLSFEEYIKFCDDLELSYEIIPSSRLKESLNIDLVHKDILSTAEAVFDIDLIKLELSRLLSKSSVKILYNTKVRKIVAGGINNVIFEDGKGLEGGIIINCTYSEINNLIEREDFQIPLRFQNVILPILNCGVRIPAMTIMDGRFCSILPKGLTTKTYILSNVRTSVLQEKGRIEELDEIESYDRSSSAQAVYESCLNYFPTLTKASIVDSWIVRKALPVYKDDRRVSSVFQIPKTSIYSVLQGKISTSRMVFNEIKKLEDGKKLD
ncbi:MAG: FAD-dependent oxidoreductase [Schleiferiaceae bacterium]|nr:FAD-dependent oxidoreductase [Schleiferiaceae bacterium]